MSKSLRFVLSFSVLAFAAFFLSSCVRQYNCRCEIVYSGKAGLPEPTAREYYVKDTKEGAKSKCQAASFTTTEMGITTTETCDLY